MRIWSLLFLFFPALTWASHCTGLNVALFNNAETSLVITYVEPEDGSAIESITAGEIIPAQLAKFARLTPTEISDGDAVGLIKLAEMGAMEETFVLKYSCHDHFLGVSFKGEVLVAPENYDVEATQWAGGFNFSSVLVFDITSHG